MENKPVNVNDFIQNLDMIPESDPEMAHAIADEILLEAIRALMKNGEYLASAYEKVRDDIGFWYA